MKLAHILVFTAVILFLSGIVNAQTIQTGTFKASKSTPDYSLDQGSGDRMVLLEVKFDKPFFSKPDVMIGVTTLDADKVRFDATCTAVTPYGFTINLKTWSDSKIFMIGGTWMAIEPAKEKAASEKKEKKGKK